MSTQNNLRDQMLQPAVLTNAASVAAGGSNIPALSAAELRAAIGVNSLRSFFSTNAPNGISAGDESDFLEFLYPNGKEVCHVRDFMVTEVKVHLRPRSLNTMNWNAEDTLVVDLYTHDGLGNENHLVGYSIPSTHPTPAYLPQVVSLNNIGLQWVKQQVLGARVSLNPYGAASIADFCVELVGRYMS